MRFSARTVSCQSVHAWVRRYGSCGLGALADRSCRLQKCPHQIAAEVEPLVSELGRAHPRGGAWRANLVSAVLAWCVNPAESYI